MALVLQAVAALPAAVDFQGYDLGRGPAVHDRLASRPVAPTTLESEVPTFAYQDTAKFNESGRRP